MSGPTSAEPARFSGGRALTGSARVPGDKSISHRALLYAGLAEGESRITGLSDGDDVRRTRLALGELGVAFGDGVVLGGRSRLREATGPIDLGNSGTGIRLLAGLAASVPFLSVLVGDASIHQRPMARIVEPLRLMGAQIDGRDGGRLAPLVIRGGGLCGIEHEAAVPSAQVKGAVLLAGLDAEGETVVREAVATRRHSEELLALAGAALTTSKEDGRYVVRLRPGPLHPFSLEVPGDPSQAAFLAVAAAVVPGSELVIERVYVGPGRAGFLDVLARMGARVERLGEGDVVDLRVRASELHATAIGGAEVADCIDELPVLAIAAAFAHGTTTITDASEMRVKESDRIAATVTGLSAIGAQAEELPDGLVVHGNPALVASGLVDARRDHRIAMAFAVAGLAREGAAVAIDGFDSTETSWPGFSATVRALT